MRRPIIFVLLAGFAALVAAMVVYSALKRRESEVQKAKLQTVDIVVAAHALGIVTKLDPAAVKTARWSRDSLPPGSFTDPGAVMNKYTKVNIVENAPIVADWLFSGEKSAGVLPLLIPPGMRALSVPVDEVSDIAGFVLPHAFVDVLVTGTAGDKPTTKIVLQNVEVLAVAQDIEQVNDKPRVVHVVTMLVTPDQAERLTLASGQGGLRLALRNYDDKQVVSTAGVSVAQLMGAQPSAAPMAVAQHVSYAPPRPRAKPVSVEVMRNGTSTESVSFVHSGAGRSSSMQPVRSESPAPAPAKEEAPAADDSSGKSGDSSYFAPAASTMPVGTPPTSSLSSSGDATGVSASRTIDGAAAPSIASVPGGSSLMGSPYSGPTAKTIDVP
jgi:pilus assembly protein CpaB